MTTIISIQNWLQDSSDYYQGISLFSKISKNSNLIARMSRGETDYNVEKLKYELDKFLENEKHEETSSAELSERSAKSTASNEVDLQHYQGDDDKNDLHRSNNADFEHIQHGVGVLVLIKSVTKKRNNYYAKRNFCHAQLSGKLSNSERLDLAKQVIEFQPLIDDCNYQLKFLETNNSIPDELKSTTKTSADLRSQLNIKSYISRYKSKIENATSIAEKEKYQELLSKYEKQL